MSRGYIQIAFWPVVMAAIFSGAAMASADVIYVEETKARIRSGPGTDYSVLWEAPRYSPLEFLAKYKDWYAVRDFQKDVGWVHEGSVAKGKAAIVTESKANVRKSPDPKGAIAFVVERHYVFRVMESRGGWLKVKDADEEEGWIQDNLVWVSR